MAVHPLLAYTHEVARVQSSGAGTAEVTTGTIEPTLRDVGVPTPVNGTVELEGLYGNRGGTHDGTDVTWSGTGRWTNVPKDVWDFSVGGFQLLPKWLSYRVNTGLTHADRETFRLLCRRIAAIRALEPECDALFNAAAANPLQA